MSGTEIGRQATRRGLTLLMLYLTQYVGVGFVTIGLVSVLRDDGTALETLGALGLIGLIWPLKVLWAPLLDRFGSASRGHYRSWLLVLQPAMVLALLALLPFGTPADHLGAVAVICAVYVFLSATQDIAVDAIAVRMLTDGERGTGNGIQLAGAALGTVLGGGICLVVHDRFGWTAAIGLLAALTAGGLVTVWRFREPARNGRADRTRTAYGALLSVFGRPGCRGWTFGVVTLLYVGSAAAWSLVTPALVDAGWSLARIGILTGVVVSVPAALAGLVAGRAVSRFGRARVLGTGGALLGLSIVALLPLLTGRAPAGWTTVTLSAFMAAYTAVNVVIYTVNMDLSRPASAGTDFTVLSSAGLAFSFLAGSAALSSAAWLGYPAVALGALLLLAAGVLLGLRHQHRFGPDALPAPAGTTATTTAATAAAADRPVRIPLPQHGRR